MGTWDNGVWQGNFSKPKKTTEESDDVAPDESGLPEKSTRPQNKVSSRIEDLLKPKTDTIQ